MPSKLSDIKVGDSFVIAGFEESDKGYRQRLLAMGVIKGRRAVLKRVAPAGDPVELTIGNSSVTLRKEEAQILKIERVPNE